MGVARDGKGRCQTTLPRRSDMPSIVCILGVCMVLMVSDEGLLVRGPERWGIVV